jgi:tetratricopeptide (TPR) repeat protein
VLGPDHPDVATALNNLASLLQDKGDYADAEPLYRRALAIAETTLGPEAPRSSAIRFNLKELIEEESSKKTEK